MILYKFSIKQSSIVVLSKIERFNITIPDLASTEKCEFAKTDKKMAESCSFMLLFRKKLIYGSKGLICLLCGTKRGFAYSVFEMTIVVF